MVRLIHLLPGNPEYPRDTFAGKMRMRFWRPCPSCEKVVRILPAKVSRNLTAFCVILIQIQIKIKIKNIMVRLIHLLPGNPRDGFL